MAGNSNKVDDGVKTGVSGTFVAKASPSKAEWLSKISEWFDGPVDVRINPTRADLECLLREAAPAGEKAGGLKALKAPSGDGADWLVWQAEGGPYHDEIAEFAESMGLIRYNDKKPYERQYVNSIKDAQDLGMLG